MSATHVVTGDVEPIVVYAVSSSGAALTGLTDLYVQVRRSSDGFYLDFADSTFKGAGWTTRLALLAEIDATNSPGQYQLAGGLDTGAIVNPAADDTLYVTPVQTPGTNAVLPGPGEIKVDGHLLHQHELWQVHGLDPAKPLVVDYASPAGSRQVPSGGADIDQTITTVGTTSTVSRV